jgi:hypothetical protein
VTAPAPPLQAAGAFVPSCSSDLWLGDNSEGGGGSGIAFRGRRILRAVCRPAWTHIFLHHF